jgi:hypothetical protein
VDWADHLPYLILEGVEPAVMTREKSCGFYLFFDTEKMGVMPCTINSVFLASLPPVNRIPNIAATENLTKVYFGVHKSYIEPCHSLFIGNWDRISALLLLHSSPTGPPQKCMLENCSKCAKMPFSV